jgi:hypothetical protein
MTMANEVVQEERAAPPRSRRRRWWLGCGCGCLIIVLLALLAAGLGVRMFWSYVQGYANELQAMGYERRIEGQAVEVTQPIAEQTLLFGQVVKVGAGSTTNIAIIAQLAEIDGRVQGDIRFLGQILMIKEGAVVTGNIYVKGAQAIDLHGSVEGEIEGTYQVINR